MMFNFIQKGYIKVVSIIGILSFSTFGTITVNAQNCGSDEVLSSYIQHHPAVLKDKAILDQKYLNTGFNKKAGKVLIIPIVFHVIHDFGPEKISKNTIIAAVNRLNEDYRRNNTDTQNTRSIFKPFAADMEIEFRLAHIDPNGRCTEGINYVQSSLTNFAGQNVKSLIWWDNKKYLNIWVVNKAFYPVAGVGGYAQFPGPAGGSDSTDGVVIGYNYVGASSNTSILTHEIGHWMGLYHTFSSRCNSSGDYVDDTPSMIGGSFYNCTNEPNTCDNFGLPFLTDPPDMYENFMDYSQDACQNLFTQGQKTRAHAILQLYRSQIYSNANLVQTGTDGATTTSKCLPKAAFSVSENRICEGGSVNFTDYSYNATVTKRTWTFEGGNPAKSIAASPVGIKFSTAGTYKVTLVASNSLGADSTIKFIEVLPLSATGQLPWQSGFETNNVFQEGIILEPKTNGYTWEITPSSPHWGSNSLFVHHFSETLKGETDVFYTKGLNFSGLNTPTLQFYTAHAPRNTAINDVLRVYVSKDCGLTWSLRFVKSGAALALGVEPTEQDYFPVPTDWRLQKVDLSTFKGEGQVLIRFETMSVNGNNIFIDDISVGEAAQLEFRNMHALNVFTIFPNPLQVGKQLVISDLPAEAQSIEIRDYTGRLVAMLNAEEFITGSKIVIPANYTEQLKPGIYFIKVGFENTFVQSKLMLTD